MTPHGNRSALVSPLDARRVTLGGSTIAAACGIDPYCSPIRLWCELTGRLARQPNEAMGWGQRLQPVILDALADGDYPDVEEFDPTLYVEDGERKWLQGHPDAFAIGDTRVVEAKASARGYDTPPVNYLAQVQTYLHLTGLNVGVLATLAGLRLDVVEVLRSDHQIELLLHLAERFMRYVWDDVQPAPEGHPDDRGALVELFPDAAPRTVRETREVRDARRELALLLEREKASKARMEKLRATIQNHMQGADTLVSAHDEIVATFRNVTARKVDTARLKTEAADVYERVATPRTTRRLLLA